MRRDDFKLLGYFLMLGLALGPLVYWGSAQRYASRVNEAAHKRVVRAAQHGGAEAGMAKRGATDYLFPVAGKGPQDIISRFGDPRGKRRHEGIDIKASRGTPVLAIADGVVERVNRGERGGKQIWLRLQDSTLVFYAHLHEQWVSAHEPVSAGQAIGSVGNSGNARRTRPHLHIEILLPGRQAVDPLKFYEGA